MEPLFPEGASIRLLAPRRGLRIGDVVLVRSIAGLRLHRIVFRFGPWLRTKGDRAIYLDPPVRAQDVVGVWPSTESPAERTRSVGLSILRYVRTKFGYRYSLGVSPYS